MGHGSLGDGWFRKSIFYLCARVFYLPNSVLFILSLITNAQSISSFRPFFVIKRFTIILPVTFNENGYRTKSKDTPSSTSVKTITSSNEYDRYR